MSIIKTLNMAKGVSYEKHVANILRPEYDNVWLWNDVPESILIKNKIIINYDTYSEHRRDIGIDIVAVKDDVCTFIQCKNYEHNVCINDIAGFLYFMLSNNVSGTLCYSNGISKQLKDDINEKTDTLFKITPIHIPYDNIDINQPLIKASYKPRDYQLAAIKTIDKKTYTDCILAMPCGTGKTFTVSLLAKKYNHVIILSPLKKLTFDSLESMNIFLGNKYTKILISSDGCRDIESIRDNLCTKNIIGCTYDSADVLIELMDVLTNVLIIVDEFHNLSHNNLNNPEDNMYKILSRDDKKIYLSATPNLEIEHDVIYRYEWEKAISDCYICDFNIIIPTPTVIDSDNLNKLIDLLNDMADIDEIMIQKGYFIIKSLLFNGNKKCIVYLTTVAKAKIFNNIINGLLKLLNIQCEIYTITNNTSKNNRNNYVYRFRNNDILTILLSVHILDEGIDVPECDSVFITQPNDNITNLIQRMCRCNRRTETKTSCNMYVWTTDGKAIKILDYIKNNTYKNIFNKIVRYSPIDNAIVSKNKEKSKSKKIVKDIDSDSISDDNYEPIDDDISNNLINKYECSKCNGVFTRKESLDYHTNRGTCTTKQFPCKKCKKTFTTKTSMYKHMRETCSVKKRNDLHTELLISIEEECKNRFARIEQECNNRIARGDYKLKAAIEKIKNDNETQNTYGNITNTIILLGYTEEDLSKLKHNVYNAAYKKGYEEGCNAIATLPKTKHNDLKYQNVLNLRIPDEDNDNTDALDNELNDISTSIDVSDTLDDTSNHVKPLDSLTEIIKKGRKILQNKTTEEVKKVAIPTKKPSTRTAIAKVRKTIPHKN